jgi:putative Holliday junction resolvase
MRVIGIDYGLSKSGISISDPSRKIALPYKTIRYKDEKEFFEIILEICSELNISDIVFGYPKNMNNDLNQMTDIIDNLKERFENKNFNIFIEDERLTSQYAQKILLSQGVNTGKNKEKIDLIASTLILQSFLDR